MVAVVTTGSRTESYASGGKQIGMDIPIRIDANQGWDTSTAIEILNALLLYNIQHCEEPIQRWNFMDLSIIRQQSSIKIMADESCCDEHDAERLVALKACDYFNVKLGKSGGIFRAKKIITIAEQYNIAIQLRGFLESRLGFTAAAHLALCSKQILHYDFDTPLMFVEDPVTNGITYNAKGEITLPQGNGLGASIDEKYLTHLPAFFTKKHLAQIFLKDYSTAIHPNTYIFVKDVFFKHMNAHCSTCYMDIEINKNEDAMKLAWSQARQRLEKIYEGGGKKSIEKQRERNKLTARERIAYLCDEGKPFVEIGAFAGYEMYAEHGGCPAGGTVSGVGYVSGRQCIVVANDQTVKAGAWFPITGKKNLRMQEISMENNLPIIYLVDSAGVYLPMQDEIFPDKEHFGRIFRNNAKMSAMGITQIAAVMGACVAGGAYLPIMSDETLMVEGNGSIFLAGPYLVKAAIGEDTDAETLGGALTHTAISGIADYKFETEKDCLNYLKRLVGKMGKPGNAGFDRIKSIPPKKLAAEIYGIMNEGNTKPYNMVDIIECIADAGSFDQFKEDYGKTIVCGYARVDGWAVGIVANQRLIVKSKKGEMQLGGVIYNDSADKAARFIMNCNQKKIPLVFLQDVTGFMVGSRSEHSGIIKDGAKLVNAVANSVVPKITIIVGNSYGAGNYAMCGKAYDPRFIYAWPTAKIAVMGGEQAGKTLLQIQVASLKAKGKEITAEEEKKLLDDIMQRYNTQTSPYYAAARLWVDAIIDPGQTRTLISEGIAAANHQINVDEFKTGVFQV